MALSTTDERDLLLPLFTGIEQDPLWETFLQRLLARARAQRVHLFIRPGGIAGMPPIQRTIRAHGYAPKEVAFNLETFSDAGLLPYAALRPHRVYSLEETMLADSPETVRHQREVMRAASVAHARFIRIVARGDHNAWLVLLNDRLDFGAADSALLSSLVPHFALALALMMEMRGLRLRGLQLRHPQADTLRRACTAVGLDRLDIRDGPARLGAALDTPAGPVVLHSA